MNASLANSASELKQVYSVIVIGSGYGGSISACRLAEAGHSVCLLERGKEWGDAFPASLEGLATEFRSKDSPTGLFDLKVGHDIDVFSGSGLGGTSLINANVAIEPEMSVFDQARWPTAIRNEAKSGALLTYFAKAATTLEIEPAQPRAGDAQLPLKVLAHEKSAQARPGEFKKLNLAVHFGAEGVNQHGVTMKPCTFCGNCVTGCRGGAKKTLSKNYLTSAKKAGAHIFCCMEVNWISEEGGGYFVNVTEHGPGGETAIHNVFAQTVVVAAGALGSTGILLRSKDRGLSLSGRVGHHFGSNGDQLGFGYNNDERTSTAGFPCPASAPLPEAVGPTIMSAIDYKANGKRFLIEEGAFPNALTEALRVVLSKTALIEGQDTDAGIVDGVKEVGRMLKDSLGAAKGGALNHTQVYLGMGDDDADGRVILDPTGDTRIIWGAAGWKPIFEQLSDEMLELVRPLGGTFLRNPRHLRAAGRNPVTVHPLGGCPMGDGVADGVVNANGRAFRADGSLHSGLHVVDGAVIPVALMVNPFLTIAALAERSAEHLVADLKGVPAVTSAPAGPNPLAVPVGLEFTEKMRGYVTTSITDARSCFDATANKVDDRAWETKFRMAEAAAKEADTKLVFRLTIVADDVADFMDSPQHQARVEGYVDCPLFGERRLVEQGWFNLFEQDQSQNLKKMTYLLKFTDSNGRKLTLDGFKMINNDPGFDLWQDTTTLFTCIREGWEENSPVIAEGIIHVSPSDFMKQLTTFRLRNSPGTATSAALGLRFLRFFFGNLTDTYIWGHVPGLS